MATFMNFGISNEPRKHGRFGQWDRQTLGLWRLSFPGRQAVGQHAPRATGPHDAAQAAQDLPQRIAPLWVVFTHQGEEWGNEGLLVVRHIARVCLAHAHALINSVKSAYQTLVMRLLFRDLTRHDLMLSRQQPSPPGSCERLSARSLCHDETRAPLPGP